ncbi:hypothetical protein JCM15519_30570 [Fundidesulfovibrio butyratiphilus]
MELDVRTLLLVLCMTLLMGQGFLVFLYRLGYPVPGMGSFLAGGTVLLVGLFLSGAREVIPDFFSIVLGNTCLILAYALYWTGVRRFLDRPPLVRVVALGVLFTSCGMAWLLAQRSGFCVRALFIRLCVSLLMAAMGYELLSGGEGKFGRSQRLFGWLHVINALALFAFAAQPVITGETGKFLSGKGTTGWMLLLQIVYVISLILGLIMMLGERLLNDLRAAKDAAESASRAKSEFLANMSHEMRTPLAGLSGLLRLLEIDDLDPVRQKYVTSALQAADSLAALIDDLLDVSRVEVGGELIDESAFDPSRLMAEALYPLEVLARRKGLDFLLDTARASGLLLGDPKRLRQVALNLVGNAVKFTPAGRVAVTLDVCEVGGGRAALRLVVEDTGIGILAGEVENIFDKFTQVHGDPSLGGAGLGLAICRRIARAMGGDITVQSQPGVGSRFTFAVTLQRPTGEVVAALGGQTTPLPNLNLLAELSPLRILLVEDFEPIRLSLSRILTRAGHATQCAQNGREAVEAVNNGEFDVVLMDVRMPVMDGVEATRRIRALSDPVKRRIPIVAMTAHAFERERERFLEAGMDVHLAKPVNPDDLARVLSRYAAKRPESAADGTAGMIDWAVALAYAGGNQAELRLYCANVARLLAGEIEEMANALNDKDLSLFSGKAHSLKSLAAGLGAVRLAQTLEQAELSAEKGDREVLSRLSPGLQSGLRILLRELGAFADQGAPAGPVAARENVR